MRTMHLFAGIGGGLLADLILGHTPIVAVEWDKYACQVLRERAKDGWFPNLQVWEGDVRLFNPSEYTGRVDCIHAGFPCQDISNAGKQAGVEEGTRSGLYREVLRIAGVVRPKFLFLENVSAILSVGLGTVLGDLASHGYDARWLCIKASDVGANHRRDRWWLLAYSCEIGRDHGSDNWEKRHFQNDREWNSKKTQSERNERKFRIGEICTVFSDSSSIRSPRQREYEQSFCKEKNTDRKADRIINGGEISIGWWDVEPEMGRLAYGVSNKLDEIENPLKGYGNAQVPLQAAVAFSILYEGLTCQT